MALFHVGMSPTTFGAGDMERPSSTWEHASSSFEWGMWSFPFLFGDMDWAFAN